MKTRIAIALVALAVGCGKKTSTGSAPKPAEPPNPQVVLRMENECRNNLKQFGVYLALFNAKEHRYPASLEELRKSSSWQTSSDLRCPFEAGGSGCTFVYVPAPGGDGSNPKLLVAWDAHPHPDGRRSVLRFNGVAELLDEKAFGEARQVK